MRYVAILVPALLLAVAVQPEQAEPPQDRYALLEQRVTQLENEIRRLDVDCRMLYRETEITFKRTGEAIRRIDQFAYATYRGVVAALGAHDRAVDRAARRTSDYVARELWRPPKPLFTQENLYEKYRTEQTRKKIDYLEQREKDRDFAGK